MVWTRWSAMLVLASGCSSPNAAFDPDRQGDTEVFDDDAADGLGTLGGVDSTGGGGGSGGGSGGAAAVCDPPAAPDLVFDIFRDGRKIAPCGETIVAENCQLARNETTQVWTVAGCCLEPACAENRNYEVQMLPPPDEAIVADAPRAVKFELEYATAEADCALKWVEIVDRSDAVEPLVPPLIWMSSRVIDPGGDSGVFAEFGGPLDIPCTCAEADAACCPEAVGYHELWLTMPGLPTGAPLSELDPTLTVPIPDTQLYLEANVVRAWMPPYCDARPEDHFNVRRLVQ